MMAQDIIGLLLTMCELNIEKECEFGHSCWDILSSQCSVGIDISYHCQ